jgi:hypothetical protein
MLNLIAEIEKKVVDLESKIQNQPESQEDADKLTELAARLITCSNGIRVKE